MQTTDTILLVRPKQFRRNEQTAVNNYFQGKEDQNNALKYTAIEEFDNFVALLNYAGVQTVVLQDEGIYDTPDSIFPNNVISFHGDTAILYPMFAENRRRERQLNHLAALEKLDIHYKHIIDYTAQEDQSKFLEGTGVLILDRVNQIAYCSISDRANEDLLHQFCEEQGYTAVPFHAVQQVQGIALPIYHTNVMMSVGTNFCLICWDCIPDLLERKKLEQQFARTQKEVIPISIEQMNQFAGNILEVKNKSGLPFICMSTQAFDSLTEIQKKTLEKYGLILHSSLYSIEKYGGGSARCMMAEVFLSA